MSSGIITVSLSSVEAGKHLELLLFRVLYSIVLGALCVYNVVGTLESSR